MSSFSQSKPKKKIEKSKDDKKKATVKKRTKTSTRLLFAKKDEDIHVKKVIVDKDETLHLDHRGGNLKIDEIVVKKGGNFVHDFSKAPDGFVIGKMTGDGKSVSKF